jgi:hypothetical protein
MPQFIAAVAATAMNCGIHLLAKFSAYFKKAAKLAAFLDWTNLTAVYL